MSHLNFKLFLIAFKHPFSERHPVTASNMLFSHVSQGACRVPHKVLTVKDDKEQNFNYRQPIVGLQIFHNTTRTRLIYKTVTKLCFAYVNFQETNKHKKMINMCLKWILQLIIFKRKTYKVVSSLHNSTELLIRKCICRFMLKFIWFYFQVRFCSVTNKKFSERQKLIPNICNNKFLKRTWRPFPLIWEADFNGFETANHCYKKRQFWNWNWFEIDLTFEIA